MGGAIELIAEVQGDMQAGRMERSAARGGGQEPDDLAGEVAGVLDMIQRLYEDEGKYRSPLPQDGWAAVPPGGAGGAALPVPEQPGGGGASCKES